MADACSTIADKRAEWERAHPEDDKAKVCCICSYCGEHIKESSAEVKPYVVEWSHEQFLDNCRGVWWVIAPGHDTWTRIYERYGTAADHEGERIVELRRCHRCSEEERVIIDTTCTCASDTDSDDWGQGSMAL